MLPFLGALALEGIDSALIANLLRYGLMTLGATLVAGQLKKEKPKKVDVFTPTEPPEVDAFGDTVPTTSDDVSPSTDDVSPSDDFSDSGSDGASNSSSDSGEDEDDDTNTGGNIGEIGNVEGSNLLEVLTSSGQATAQGLKAVASSIEDLRWDITNGFDNVVTSIDYLRGDVVDALNIVADNLTLLQSQQRVSEEDLLFKEQLLKALTGIGAVLGAIGLSLTKLTEVFTTPVEVNPEEHITTARNPLEMIAKASGVQAKTFADINSFNVEEDIDLPDLPNGIDISQIFRFLRVSQQLRG